MPPRTTQRIPYQDLRGVLGDRTDRQDRGCVSPRMQREIEPTDERIAPVINAVEVSLLIGHWEDGAKALAGLVGLRYVGVIRGPKLSSVNARYVAFDLIGYWLRNRGMVTQAINVLEKRSSDPDLTAEPVTRQSPPSSLGLSVRLLANLDELAIRTVGQLANSFEGWHAALHPVGIGNVELAAIHEALERHSLLGPRARERRLKSYQHKGSKEKRNV